eukprot:38787_1
MESQTRLINVIIKHKNAFVDADPNEISKHVNIIEFLSSFDSYSLPDFLNDFHQHIKQEQRNSLYPETVYNKLIKELNGHKCAIQSCNCISRRSDNIVLHSKQDSTYNQAHVYHEIFDTVHVYLLHIFDMGCRLLQSEREQVPENQLSDFIRNKRKRYNLLCGSVNLLPKHNKFVTVKSIEYSSNDNTCFYEALINELVSTKINSISIILNPLHTWLKQQQYDTEAICEDVIDNQSNIKNITNNDSIFQIIQNYVFYRKRSVSYYSFGYRYYYWKFFKENMKEQNIIYESFDRKSTPIRQWYDPGNKAYKCFQWYISEKYQNLKQEIIYNQFSKNKFSNSVTKAKQYLRTKQIKKTKANKYWCTVYDIPRKLPISLNHIIALLLYCDYSDLCYWFSLTYRKMDYCESDAGLKSRHRNFFHFGKLLRE